MRDPDDVPRLSALNDQSARSHGDDDSPRFRSRFVPFAFPSGRALIACPNMTLGPHVTPFSIRRAQPAAFTLVELVVTMAVAAVLLTIAIPSFQTVIQNSRIATQANSLLTDLNYARSEALRRNLNVGICASNDGATCGGANWGLGRIVFADSNGNGALDAGEALRVQQGITQSGNTLTVYAGAPVAATPTLIMFGRVGNVVVPALSADFPIALRVCDARGQPYGRDVLIPTATGQTRTAAQAGSGAC